MQQQDIDNLRYLNGVGGVRVLVIQLHIFQAPPWAHRQVLGSAWLSVDDDVQVCALQAGGRGADAPKAPEAADDDGAPGTLVCEVPAQHMRTGQVHVMLWPLLLLQNELPCSMHYRQLAPAADGEGDCPTIPFPA